MALLDVKNLCLSFNIDGSSYQALHNISFSLDRAQVLALAGESGCGKTITAMSILRLIPQNAQITSGEILYKGTNLLQLKENEMRKIRGKHIALIPQDPMTSLNPLFTIGSQIIEVIELHRGLKGAEAEKAAAEALDRVKIPNAKSRLKSYPHEFSGGMRQRAVIAAALACGAEIIIADEPSTALDVTVQAQIIDLMKEIKENSHASFIFISHDFGLISEFADKVCVMYAGGIAEYASAGEIFSSPKHPYTKALIKALPDFNSVKLEPVEGQPPSVKDVFPGCPFEPRCLEKIEKCSCYKPMLYKTDGSETACLLYEKK